MSGQVLREIEGRRAKRGFDGRAVPAEIRDRLIEAVRLSPSCFNNQPWRLALAESGQVLQGFREALNPGNAWAKKAPLLAAFLTKPSLDCRMDGGRDYAYFDCGIAAMALMLQAQAEGLIAHPIAGYSPEKVRKALGAGADYVPIAMVVIGYPGAAEGLEAWQLERETGPRQRKEAAEISSIDSWIFT